MGVFAVAHDLHLHVAEVRQALVIGGFLPQPDVGGPGAGRGAQQTAGERTGRWAKIRSTDVSAVLWPTCSRHRLSPDLREASAGGYCTQFIDEEAEAQQVKLRGRAQTLSPVFLSPASPKLTPRLRLSNEEQFAFAGF